ncbi:MAG: hypothetical protein HUU27_09610 [Phycisphaerae bacterium]|nr:hypothetical protein [Phycisphaerae bacterium]
MVPRRSTISFSGSLATASEAFSADMNASSHANVATTAASTSTVNVVVVRRTSRLRQ